MKKFYIFIYFKIKIGKDQSDTLEILVMILDAYKQTLPIIKLGINQEVESTTKESTLFRFFFLKKLYIFF